MLPEAVSAFVSTVVDRTQTVLGDDLEAVYLVGSLATGDARPDTSDVDVMVVARGPLGEARRTQLTDAVLEVSGDCPLAGLEYVVYSAAALAPPTYPLAYELNVNGGPKRARHVSSAGDPPHWFLLDVAMARQHAVVLHGPPVCELIGEPGQAAVRAAIADALEWHAEHEPGSANALLNASRSRHYLETGRWVSKTDAANWVRRFPDMVHAQGWTEEVVMAETKTWTVDVVLTETPDKTDAQATLRMGDAECVAEGHARRNPEDPNVPRIGEEVATARALAQLSSKLLEESAKILEGHLGRPVDISP